MGVLLGGISAAILGLGRNLKYSIKHDKEGMHRPLMVNFVCVPRLSTQDILSCSNQVRSTPCRYGEAPVGP